MKLKTKIALFLMSVGINFMYADYTDSFNIDPPSGSVVQRLISIHIRGGQDFESQLGIGQEPYIKINDESVKVILSTGPDMVTISLRYPIDTPGEYTIIIPARLFKYVNLGLPRINDEIILTYSIQDDNSIKDEFPPTSVVKDIISPTSKSTIDSSTITEIYNLNGDRINQMVPGKINIIRQGKNTRKVLVK